MDNRLIRELVEEVLTVCKYDDTGVSDDLLDPALRVAVEIGMTQEEIEEFVNALEDRQI